MNSGFAVGERFPVQLAEEDDYDNNLKVHIQ